MLYSKKLRSHLLGSSALAVGAFMLAAGGTASAGIALEPCDGGPATAGGSITCSGDHTYAMTSGFDDLTVTLNADANVSYSNGPVIQFYGASNDLVLKDSSTIVSSDSYSAVLLSGDDGTVTLNGGASITLYGVGGNGLNTAVDASGAGISVTLNGGSSIVLVGEAGERKYAYGNGVTFSGDGSSLTLNGGSHVDVTGGSTGDPAGSFYNEYSGVFVRGASATVALNGGSSVNLTGTGTGYGRFTGIHAGGSYAKYIEDVGSITLNGGSSVNVATPSGSFNTVTGVSVGYGGIRKGRRRGGYASSLTLSGGSSINVGVADGDVGRDNKYVGATLGGIGGVLTLNDTSSINVTPALGSARGIGIDVSAQDSAVTLNGSSVVRVAGEAAYAAYGIRLYGQGNVITLNGTSSVQENGTGDYSSAVSMRGYYNELALNDQSSVVSSDGYGVIVWRGYSNTVALSGDASVQAYRTGIALNVQRDTTLTLNDDASVTSEAGAGIDVDYGNSVAITLNGRSSVVGDKVGILVHGEYYDGWGTYYSSDVTITVSAGASVTGKTGIVFAENTYNSQVFVAGTVTGTMGTAIDFSDAGNNSLSLGTGAVLNGDVLGATGGYDALILTGHGTLSAAVSDFDFMGVSADGIWNLTSDLDLSQGGDLGVVITTGELAVNSTLTTSTVTVLAGGTLGGSGDIIGDVQNFGTISPGNSPGTLTVFGNVNFNPGSGFVVQVENNVADLLNVVGGDVTIDPGTSITMQFLGGVDGFVGEVITATGSVVGTFTTFIGGTFDYSTPGVVSLTSASPSSINGAMSGGASVGFAFLDAVIGNAETGVGTGKSLWSTGLWQNSDRSSTASARGFNQRSRGFAFGGDVWQSGSLTLGLAAGYIDSDVNTVGGGTKTGIKGYNAALYGAYGFGNTFATSAVTVAWQDQDVKRNVLSGGAIVSANSSPNAFATGVGFSIGHVIPVQGAWTLTPKVSVGWQHVTRDAYSETGGGLGAMSVNEVTSDTLRAQVGAELALTIKAPDAKWTVRPALRAAIARETRSGDDMATGTFITSGAAFGANLDNRNQTYLAVGAGVDVTVGNGITAFVNYDGGFGGDAEKSGAVRLGARLEW